MERRTGKTGYVGPLSESGGVPTRMSMRSGGALGWPGGPCDSWMGGVTVVTVALSGSVSGACGVDSAGCGFVAGSDLMGPYSRF